MSTIIDRDALLLLIHRLERISADSRQAHLASGIRGALLKALDHVETGNKTDDPSLQKAISIGYRILEQAARETISTSKL